MLKFTFTLVAIFGALAVMYIISSRDGTVFRETFDAPMPHFYGQPAEPISTIRVHAFYFVPSDRSPVRDAAWVKKLESVLSDLSSFHNLALRHTSTIRMIVRSEPILGERQGDFYDTEATEHNSAQQLELITAELARKNLIPPAEQNSFPVHIIIYEGPGAAGDKHVALLSRAYLTRDGYGDIASSFLAHEFYHALGLPDHYLSTLRTYRDTQSGVAEILTSEDIMGFVRRPLDRSYIERDELQNMGL